MFITATTLRSALPMLWGTADHMLKIWLVLKQMGLAIGEPPVLVTTSSPTEALERLFGFGDPDGQFFVPFAHTTRFATMKGDAARSIVQTNVRRWQDSGSVVGTDPSGFLTFSAGSDASVSVAPGRHYPLGLGLGRNGFSLEEGTRTTVPAQAFAVWYSRRSVIEDGADLNEQLLRALTTGLSLTRAELDTVFVDHPIPIELQNQPLSPAEIYHVVQSFLQNSRNLQNVTLMPETFEAHSRKVRAMTSLPDGPQWLRVDPASTLKSVLDGGARSVLLTGPPRTGKTHAIDSLRPRNSADRETIQIHDGWSYDELMLSYRPTASGWQWIEGPLLLAIRANKSLVVLEEVNRTNFTQALGEVFSLVEAAYRGAAHSIRLRDGSTFFVPEQLVLVGLMNTLDKSTQDIDDAIFGRFSSVDFPPRVEALHDILNARGIKSSEALKLAQLFSAIQTSYPLGHAYFSDFTESQDPLIYYTTRIRPVLVSHLQHNRRPELDAIDNLVDELFSAA